MAEGEADRWLELLQLAGVQNEGDLLAAVRRGRLGWLLLFGLAEGRDAMGRRFLETLSPQTDEAALDAMAGLSMPVIVQARDGSLVGALHAVSLPPATVANAADRGIPFEVMLAALVSVVKIRAVAVEGLARGMGIGSALLTRCLQLYFQLGFRLAYGQFRSGSGLDAYYSRRGFEILDEQEAVDLARYLGLPFRFLPDDQEQFFTYLHPDLHRLTG